MAEEKEEKSGQPRKPQRRQRQQKQEAPPNEPEGTAGPKRLYRSQTDRYVAGVCGGVAEYLSADPMVVRIVWLVSVFFGGLGLFAYIAAWILVPENPDLTSVPVSPRDTQRSRNFGLVAGLVLIFLGLMLFANQMHYYFDLPWHFRIRLFDMSLIGAIVIIAIGAYLILSRSGTSSSEVSDASEPGTKKKLKRSVIDRKIAGVCGGLGKYFDIDPSIIRIGFIVLGVAEAALAVITYIVMMVVLQEDEQETVV